MSALTRKRFGTQNGPKRTGLALSAGRPAGIGDGPWEGVRLTAVLLRALLVNAMSYSVHVKEGILRPPGPRGLHQGRIPSAARPFVNQSSGCPLTEPPPQVVMARTSRRSDEGGEAQTAST